MPQIERQSIAFDDLYIRCEQIISYERACTSLHYWYLITDRERSQQSRRLGGLFYELRKHICDVLIDLTLDGDIHEVIKIARYMPSSYFTS